MKVDLHDRLEAVGPAAWGDLHGHLAFPSPSPSPAWQRRSAEALAPGLVLLAHMIQDAIAHGKTRFDFRRGEERHKYEFGPIPEDLCQVRPG